MKTRLSAVFALLIMMLTLQTVAQQVNYSSIDSADVYAHLRSGDPAYGTYMGVWGFNGVSFDPAGWPPTDGDRYAHGYVQWQLSGFTPGVQYHVTSAVMTVYQLKNPKWTLSNPGLELRILGSNWSEATWVYSNTSNPIPGEILALGDRSALAVNNLPVPITFDLNTDDFENYLNSSVTGGVMSFALTTPMDPGGPASGLFYTLRTRDYTDQTLAPKLVITAEPEQIIVSANPCVLWPPNHKMVDVVVTETSADSSNLVPVCKIVSVTSNEPINGLGDGDTAPDWQITGNMTVKLRAERSGTGTGRVYTIVVQCTYPSGNVSTGSVAVVVPNNKGK